MKKSITVYKIFGALLIVCAVIGFFTVADEFRHSGELIGVAAVMFAGIILFLADFKLSVFKNIAIQWISFCLLASIPVGGILLDNMLLGVGIGFIIGIVLAFLLGKKYELC